ncbi:hypothetical protein SH661x_004403 [Planctomicrobium sp. SH661]|uniref:hypothetical protein n=1 Tax=Planctomicrobium sp. SH661 TaxID=3448124 RepID=UPI003F5BD134
MARLYRTHQHLEWDRHTPPDFLAGKEHMDSIPGGRPLAVEEHIDRGDVSVTKPGLLHRSNRSG